MTNYVLYYYNFKNQILVKRRHLKMISIIIIRNLGILDNFTIEFLISKKNTSQIYQQNNN